MNTKGTLPRILFAVLIAGTTITSRAQMIEPEKGSALEAAPGLRTQALVAYPNPFNDALQVNIPVSYRRAVRIDLYPAMGGTTGLHQEMTWAPSAVLNTSGLPNGSYTLSIRQMGENGMLLGVARVTCVH